jgi:hypothetical protein
MGEIFHCPALLVVCKRRDGFHSVRVREYTYLLYVVKHEAIISEKILKRCNLRKISGLAPGQLGQNFTSALWEINRRVKRNFWGKVGVTRNVRKNDQNVPKITQYLSLL